MMSGAALTGTVTMGGMSELEAKRLAVIESMKKRREASRSNSPALAGHDLVKPVGENVINDSATLEDAILDLRSMGYSFDKILDESGVSRSFLEICYDRWNFPVPRQTLPAPASALVPPVVNHAKQSFASSLPYVAPQRLFAHKVYRNPGMEKPEWLKDLVIDLESSASESDSEEEPPSVPECWSATTTSRGENDREQAKEASHDTKRRKVSNEGIADYSQLETVRQKEADLELKMDEMRVELERSHEIHKDTEYGVEICVCKLQEHDEAQEDDINDLECRNTQVDISGCCIEGVYESVDSTPSPEIVIFEHSEENEGLGLQEETESSKFEAEQKRLDLRKRLLLSMKKGITRTHNRPQDQNGGIAQRTGRNDEKFHLPNNEFNDEMIHKIPKAQASHFTPYRSLGLSRKTVTDAPGQDQHADETCDMLCPLELVNGVCATQGKGCKFQHLKA